MEERKGEELGKGGGRKGGKGRQWRI